MRRNKIIIFISSLILLTLSFTFMSNGLNKNPFKDVNSDSYCFDAVNWAVENEVTSGTSKDTFSPSDFCTRAQIVTFLYRAAGKPSVTSTSISFTDVDKNEYYYDAVIWAVSRGITSGVSATQFDPNSPCTRAQAVTFLWRAVGEQKINNASSNFVDLKEGEYYINPVYWAVENNITNGVDDTHFAPNDTCERGQIVTFLYRLLSNQPRALEEGYMRADLSKLDGIMNDMFDGTEVLNETVMFLDEGDTKELLYDIDKIISVTSYDGKTVYEEGKDYKVVNGKLKALSGTSIPIITRNVYYNCSTNTLITMYQGQRCNTWWGEEDTMTRFQINVSYTHKDQWDGYKQDNQSGYLDSFIAKLERGEDVTIVFFGDSITYGACSSYTSGYEPFQYSYPLMLTKSLAQVYEYKVRYVQAISVFKVPTAEKYGTRGKITYINASVGGWNSRNGLDNYDTYLKNLIDKLGCDLFVVAFGMNDGNADPTTYTYANIKKLVGKMQEQAPDTSLLFVSTMVPNPNAVNGWYGKQDQQEAVLINGAKEYREKGVECAVAKMTSVSKAVLEHKEFYDYSGNNINHPNDFFSRVYAQTLFQTIIGY